MEPSIARAKTLHTDFYTSREMYEQSKEKIFASSWQFIGDTDLVKEPSSVYPFTLLENFIDEPLVLTQDKQSNVHLLSNVCTHRGNIVADKACTSTNLRCKYHGRIFHLDGSFVSMPEFKEVENFPTKDDDLKQLPLYRWGKLLFTSLDKDSSPDKYFKEMVSRLSWLPINEFEYKPELSKDYIVKSHWALYCENYLEGFHIPFVHAGLNEVIDFGNYTTELYDHATLNVGVAKTGDDCFDIPSSSPDHGLRGDGQWRTPLGNRRK